MWNQIGTMTWNDGSTIELLIKGTTILMLLTEKPEVNYIYPEDWNKFLEPKGNSFDKIELMNTHLIPNKLLDILGQI